MATTTDRPRGKESPPLAAPAAGPGSSTPAQAPSAPARASPGTRLRGALHLFGPLVAAAIGLLALVAVIVAVALGGGDTPATGAAELVPGNALIYVHLSTDASRQAVRQALAVSRRLPDSPLLLAAVTNRLGTLLSGSSNALVDFPTQVRPWLGKEAAFAVLDSTTASAGSLIVLDVRNRSRARDFLASQAAQPDGRFRGFALFRQPS